MHFDKKIFNHGYAFYFTALQRCLFIGFAFMLVAVMLGATTNLHLTISDFMIGPLFVSFVAFPIVSII